MVSVYSCLKKERATKHCLRYQKQSRPGKLVLKNARVLRGRSNHSPDIWNMRQSSCECLTQGFILETPNGMGSLTLRGGSLISPCLLLSLPKPSHRCPLHCFLLVLICLYLPYSDRVGQIQSSIKTVSSPHCRTSHRS